ncbi:uncharacterized protein LOC131214326, partial [Anopheles bellator]|uniref:uncharacterized protein LOC131214326 n=1 Tax=Anopheles bellator TaxID=139047 RepID=UPI002647E3B6
MTEQLKTDEKVAFMCERLTKLGLVHESDMRGLPTTGNKEEMAKAIVEYDSRRNQDACGSKEHRTQVVNEVKKKIDLHRSEKSASSSSDNEYESDASAGVNRSKRHSEHYVPTRRTMERPLYSFREVEGDIDAFGAEEGEDVRVWMRQLEKIAKTANWDDDHKLLMCRRKLIGTARRFLASMRSVETFVELKGALLKEFAPIVRASDVHRMLAARRRRASESVRDYVYDMQRIALTIDLEESSICEYIVDGITDDEYYRSQLYEAQSIEELKKRMSCFEKAQRRRTDTKQRANCDANGEKKERPMNDATKQSNKNERKKHCYNCGGTTHVANECPQKNDGPKCFKCSAFGHRAKDCTETGRKHPSTKVSTVQCINKANPSMALKILGRDFKAVVDTGSEVTLIRRDAWAQLFKDGGQMKASTMQVCGYGGEISTVDGEVKLNTIIDDESYDIRFYIVPNTAINVQLLIGMDFLNEVNYAITPDGVKVKKYHLPNDETERCEAEWIRCIAEVVDDKELSAPYPFRGDIKKMVENYHPKESVVATNTLTIRMKDDEITCDNPRRLAPLEKEVVKKQIDEWMKNGIIQPSESEYASPVVVVPKKDGSYRVCVDYRQINKRMMRDKFPMPSTRKSYNYILTVIDAFTKFVWLFPTKSTTAEEAIRKLRVINDTFGNPRRIICDRGAAFTSGLFEKFCEDENVELHKIATGVPRGNGQVERVHRIIIPMITKLSIDKPEEWFKQVPRIQKCLNNSWQRAI